MLMASAFAWLVFSAIFVPLMQIGIIRQHLNSVPKQASFTREEVRNLIYQAGTDVVHQEPWILVPSLMMLVGCILVMKRNKNQEIPNN